MIIWTQTTRVGLVTRFECDTKNFKTPRTREQQKINENYRSDPNRSKARGTLNSFNFVCLDRLVGFFFGLASELHKRWNNNKTSDSAVESDWKWLKHWTNVWTNNLGLHGTADLEKHLTSIKTIFQSRNRVQRSETERSKAASSWEENARSRRALHSWRAQVGGKSGARSPDSKQIIYGK